MTSKQELRTVIITGASRGIGRAIALRFASEGARLVLSAVSADALRDVAMACGGSDRVREVAGDLGDPNILARITASADELGGADVVVNNAFWEEHGDVADVSLEGWDRTLRVCLTAPMLLIKGALPGMIGKGRGWVVNVGSAHALLAGTEYVAYEAAKAGLLALTRSVAVNYGRRGVRANVVSPGLVMSERMVSWWADASDRVREAMLATIPVGRAGSPEEIAEVVAFAASPAASFMNGAMIAVDGGATSLLAEVATLQVAGEKPPVDRVAAASATGERTV